MTLTPGTHLGPYEILAPLGTGGMGEVYRAKDTRLDRQVAVKVLPAAFAEDPSALARFEREAKAVAALSHPNILAVHDVGHSEGVRYAVMELLEGESLRQRLSEGPIPQRKAIEIAREIALGLAAAHEKGIVHRDLKPENLFLTRDGRVKILDFGLARQLSLPSSGDTHSPTAVQVSEPGLVLGTVGYMSPEQLRGQPADHRSDVFSFGAVLYEMLSGKRAFLGDTAIETMNAILKDDPPELSTSGRAIPPALERIVHHCLEKRPEERFQSARDLAFDLSSLSSATPVAGAAAVSESRPRARNLAIAAAAIAALAVAFWAGGRFVAGAKAEGRFRRLTFRRGNLLSARFTPDGQTIVYGAAWEGKPSELFSVRTDSVESRPLGVEHAEVLSVSSKGELAIKLRRGSFQVPSVSGTLARVPLGGGAPRELEENVYGAVWTPDGNDMAILRFMPDGKSRLEWPIGHVLYESYFLGNTLAMSPGGDLVAYTETDNAGHGGIWVTDGRGARRALTRGWTDLDRIVWSPQTDEILFTGSRVRGGSAVRAVSRSGKERVLWRTVPGFVLHDVAGDGRLLIERFAARRGVIWRAPGATQDKELGWLDGTVLASLSPDGSEILFSEIGDGAGGQKGVYLRPTNGGPAIRLGDGTPISFSPDGKWVVAISAASPPEVVLLPIGPGSPRKIPTPGLTPVLAFMMATGDFVILSASPGEPFRPYVIPREGGRPTPINLSNVNWDAEGAFSRDGSLTAYSTTDRKLMIAVTRGATRPIPNALLAPGEFITVFSDDNRFVQTQTHRSEIPARIYRTDVQTGAKTLWKEIQPADSTGVIGIGQVHFARGDVGYAYTYGRVDSSDLYVVERLE